MGQQEVYSFLKKNRNRWFLSKEIAEASRTSLGSVTNCLKKLRDANEINFKETDRKNQFKYKFGR